jgi:cyclopropane-fatty-acyl-phospholipid synthase
MWGIAFERFLRRLIVEGRLDVRLPGRAPILCGDGTGPFVSVTIADKATARRLLLDPELALGETYTDGRLTIDGDDLQGFLEIVMRNAGRVRDISRLQRLTGRLRRLRRARDQDNRQPLSRRNVAHHYDLTPAIYDLFLDEDRQYSCAYFTDAAQTLDAAQRAKKAHIARKLLIRPGMRVLDIGCGWGGLALSLARDHGAQVTGITLSSEQLAIARARVQAAGLADRVTFALQDYRDLTETYDRIVSVGMFEHVGAPYFDTFFAAVRDHLAPDGVALIHTIGRTAPPGATNPWIAKYIFPGGYVPSLSEVATAIQTTGLRIGDIECLRLHYALTLRHWFDRFSAQADRAAHLMDDRFVRMWRYYLAASEQTFRHSPQDVFQFQLTRRVDAVPITRDYLYPPAQAMQQAAE